MMSTVTPVTIARSPIAIDRSGTPVLEARNLSLYLKTPGGRELKVIDNLDLTIFPGDFFALVGESGSGKTMFARAIMRLLSSKKMRIEGTLRLDDVDIASASDATMQRLRGKSVSMIFQEPMTSLNPIQTVEQQISETMEVHGNGNARARREKILQLLTDALFHEPAQVASMYPHELSGGMRQRVMIAMALANDPTLLIADEPTTALDVTVQHEIMEILFRLRERYNLSVLFISHDLALVYRYADMLAVLYGGVLMERGPTQQVVEGPTHPYTAALLACMPRYRENGVRQQGIEGNVPRVDDWFTGCRFAPRCSRRQDVCTQGDVPFIATRADQEAKCLFPLSQ